MLNTPVLISSTSATLGAEVHRLLAPFSATVAEVPEQQQFLLVDQIEGSYRLYRDHHLLTCSASHELVVNVLLGELNGRAIEEFPGFAAHAGVVASADKAVAFPAASGQGKSTMVAACLTSGLTYVSDEALCVEFDSATVIPYPKPLQLSPASCRALERIAATARRDVVSDINMTADDLGAPVACSPLELGHVVRLVRRPGPDLLTEVAPANAASWLLELSFNHYKRPEQAFDVVTDLARRSHAWYLEYEEAASAAVLLAEQLAG